MRYDRDYHVVTVLEGRQTRSEVRDVHNQVIRSFRGSDAYGKAKRLCRQLMDTSNEPRPAGRLSQAA